MTKPIFEPTPQRQVSALRFDKNQLFRRPAPHVETGGNASWGRRNNSSTQTIPTGTPTQVVLDEGAVAPAQSDISLITDGLHLDGGGFWIVTLRIFWDPPFAETCYCWVNASSSQSVALLSELSPGFINRLLIVWPYPDYPDDLFAWVQQNSAGDQVLYSASLSAKFDETYGGTPDPFS